MFQIKTVLNIWRVTICFNFWDTLYSEITEQLQNFSQILVSGEFTLSFVKMNVAYIHVPIASK